MVIESQDRFRRRQQLVLGQRISYVDEGTGPTILLLHGSSTHSYYWRNLIRYLARDHRCLAPDWMGTGGSGKRVPSGIGTYTFSERRTDLDSFLELIGPAADLVIASEEIGTVHALDWTRRHPTRVRGLVVIEGVLGLTDADSLPTEPAKLLLRLRSEEGEDLALRQNAVVDQYLPELTLRNLTPKERANYRAPFELPGEARRAPLTMLRDLPLEQDAGPIDDLVEELRIWLSGSGIPKLVIGGDPGYLLPEPAIRTCSKWPATETLIVPGYQLLLEDSPQRITAAVQSWLSGL